MRGWVWLAALGMVGCSKGTTYEDSNNYTYSGTLTVEQEDVAAVTDDGTTTDILVDWSTIQTDIRGRPLDPATVEQVSIIKFSGTYEEILPKVERNEVGQSDAQDIYLFENIGGATSAMLSEFTITGISMDLGLLQDNPEETWFLSLVNMPDGRTDILSSIYLKPTAGSQDAEVAFEDSSAKLDVEVDFQSAPPLQAKAGKAPVFDWRGATQDVFGHPFDDQLGDELIIGHYDMDLAEVEASFLQLDTVATELYRLNVFSQRQADLAQAIDDKNQRFQGFTADGTWLIGIICSTCTTPIPLILSVVEVN